MTATEERSAKSKAAWERLRAEGRAGWTDERRAKYRATMAVKFPKDHRRPGEILMDEVSALRGLVTDLLERVQALESRPEPTQGGLVEWRPDHRRQADGGRPVRAQRRAVGLPKRPKAAA